MSSRNRRARCGAKRRQLGLGLVEILVALAISLFLLGGLFTIFFTTRQTFAAQNGLTALQDNQRFAMTVVANVVQAAGYFLDPLNSTAGTALPSDATYATAGQSIFGTAGLSASAPDTVSVRFRAAANDPNVMNCLGDTAGASATTFDNRFSIGSSALLCNGTTLVDGVGNLKVLYGLDTTGDGSVTRYVSAGGVTDWTAIKTVRVTFTFVNPLAGQPGQPGTIAATRVINLSGQGQS